MRGEHISCKYSVIREREARKYSDKDEVKGHIIKKNWNI
jgi:hypothetical protein